MEHTKGEWKRFGWLVADKDDVLIADCRHKTPSSAFESYQPNTGTSVDETTANTQLIASAPDLYEAVRWVLEDYQDKRAMLPVSTHTQLLKALAKAEK